MNTRMNRDLKRGLVVGAVLAAASGLLACSFVVTRGETQCAGPDDTATCTNAFGPGARCTADGVCVTKGGGSCTTNTECIDREGGAPAICRKDTKVCVRLTNADCPSVIAVDSGGRVVTDRRAVESDDTIVLGSLASLYGTNQTKGEARVAAFQLALQEFSARPLPIAGRTRPLAFLSCTDTEQVGADAGAGGDPAVVRSAKHLMAVGVPAVVGAGNSGTTTSALVEITAKGSVLIAPSATSPALTSNPNKKGLFFRTAPSDALQAIPLAAAIGDVEKALPAGTKKLVFISKGDSYGQGLRDQLIGANLTLNGAAIGAPATYKGLEYGTEATFDFSQRIAETIAFEPQIIVIAGTNEGVEKLVKPLEAQWPAGKPRPVFVVSDGLKSASLLDLIKADDATSNPSPLRNRIRGTAPGRPTPITASYTLRFTSTFPDPRIANEVGSFGTAGAYDAAYLILYALGFVSGDKVDGQGIATGVRRLAKKGATAVEVGPNGIDIARPFFTSGTDFDLNGASSPLDFNEAGESPADVEIWCVQRGAGSAGPTFFSTEKYFNASAGNVVGTYNCPSGTPAGDAGTDGG